MAISSASAASRGPRRRARCGPRARPTRSRTGTCCTFSLTLEEAGRLGRRVSGGRYPFGTSGKTGAGRRLEAGWKLACHFGPDATVWPTPIDACSALRVTPTSPSAQRDLSRTGSYALAIEIVKVCSRDFQ